MCELTFLGLVKKPSVYGVPLLKIVEFSTLWDGCGSLAFFLFGLVPWAILSTKNCLKHLKQKVRGN